MKSIRWWQYGLVGGMALSITTLVRVIRKLVVLQARGETAPDASWAEVLGFAALIFGMGFGCGVLGWAGRGISRRFGMLGDAIVGMVVMLVFFTACTLIFEPDFFLGPKLWPGGIMLFGFGAVLGLIGGAWLGHDLRKELVKQEEEQERENRRKIRRRIRR